MELAVAILGVVLALLAIAASYHIAARQGFFGGERVLLTVSQPTPLKEGEPAPPFSKEFLPGGLSRKGAVYPFLYKMPLLVTFGIPAGNDAHLVFLLVTLLNREKATVRNISVRIDLPARLMPDDTTKFSAPEDIKVRRQIDKSTGDALVEYEIDRLKPYDCIQVAEPLLLRSIDVVSKVEPDSTMGMMDLRLILRTDRKIEERKLRIIGIRCDDPKRFIEASTTLTNAIMRRESPPIRKPLWRRLLHIPAAYRATLWVQPGFERLAPHLSVHSFGRANDSTKSGILGVLLR